MRNFIVALIAVAILLVIGFFVGQSCSKEEVGIDHARENELIGEIDKLKTDNKFLITQRDSLLKIPQKIKTQIVIREREIDANIAKDSSNSIVEYRKALQDNDELPEGNERLTFREIGLGAKIMARVPKLELQ